MTTITGNILNKAVDGFKNHIIKRAHNDTYAAKALLLTTVGLNLYSNAVDYYRLRQNDDIEKEEKDFLQAFRITNGVVSAIAQAGVGLAIISNKSQNLIIKGISKFYKGFAKNLNKTGSANLLKLTSLIGAVAITKRILTPLIVTPLASWVNKKINFHKQQEDTENVGEIKENIFKNRENKFTFKSKFKKDFDYFKNNRENIFINKYKLELKH